MIIKILKSAASKAEKIANLHLAFAEEVQKSEKNQLELDYSYMDSLFFDATRLEILIEAIKTYPSPPQNYILA